MRLVRVGGMPSMSQNLIMKNAQVLEPVEQRKALLSLISDRTQTVESLKSAVATLHLTRRELVSIKSHAARVRYGSHFAREAASLAQEEHEARRTYGTVSTCFSSKRSLL